MRDVRSPRPLPLASSIPATLLASALIKMQQVSAARALVEIECRRSRRVSSNSSRNTMPSAIVDFETRIFLVVREKCDEIVARAPRRCCRCISIVDHRCHSEQKERRNVFTSSWRRIVNRTIKHCYGEKSRSEGKEETKRRKRSVVDFIAITRTISRTRSLSKRPDELSLRAALCDLPCGCWISLLFYLLEKKGRFMRK